MGMNLSAKLRSRGHSAMKPGDSVTEIRRPMQSNDCVIRSEWLDIRAVSVMNRRENNFKRADRTKEHRQRAFNAFAGRSVPALPVTVMLMRCAPQDQDDDNLRAALKAVRDGVADLYGIPDNDRRLHWLYFQQKQSKWQVKVCIKQQGEECKVHPSGMVVAGAERGNG